MKPDLNTTPHRRLNILTQEWVLVSPHRSARPWQGKTEDLVIPTANTYEAACYLCPGNTRANGQQNPAYTDTYWFTNDFPALLPDAPGGKFSAGLFVAQAERGTCRVICFSPDHSQTLATMSVDQLERVIQLWQAQYEELGALDFVNHVQIFENKGAMMGCSNPHPHGQIWSQESVPQVVVKKGESLARYSAQHPGKNLLEDYLAQEIADGSRLLYSDAHVAALVPWWAVWPYEVVIAPRRATPSIDQLTAAERTAFAQAISTVTRAYDRLFAVSFPYSAGIHQAPTDGHDHSHWHWHMEFKPPLLRSATVKKFMVGYELFALSQRDITAEQAAARLREHCQK